MYYWIFEAAFILLVFIIVKLTYQRVTLAEGKSVVIFIGGVFLLALGVAFCFLVLPDVIDSGKFITSTRNFSVRAHQSRQPVLYWFLVVLGYGLSVVLSWMGSIVILPYFLDGFNHPVFWKKEGDQWHYQTPFLTASASFDVTMKTMVIKRFQPKGTTLTAYQPHDFLWKTYRQFPERDIRLPRTPMFHSPIDVLMQAGCIRFSPKWLGLPSCYVIEQVIDPAKSRPYEH